MKNVAGGLLLLAAGMALGWWLRGTTFAGLKPRATPITNTAQAAKIIAASAVTTQTAPATMEPAKFTPTDRVKSLAAITRRGRSRFFVNAIAGNKLDGGFIEMYGLSDAEATSLNASLAVANNRMTEIAMSLATAQTDDERKKLAVHVPPFPDAGGVVHDQVIAAFREVLGPERFAAFSVLSADGVETSFGAFGLNDTTYTMKLIPSEPGRNGDAAYEIDMRYTSANGTWGTNHSNLMGSGIADSFPVLARFIPSGIIPPKK